MNQKEKPRNITQPCSLGQRQYKACKWFRETIHQNVEKQFKIFIMLTYFHNTQPFNAHVENKRGKKISTSEILS